MKLELKKFDPSKIASDSVVVFIGKRNTGKSYCMKDILSYHRSLPIGIVVSPTEKANGYFEKFIPKMLLYDEPDEKIIKTFLERQMKISGEKKLEIAKNGRSQIDNRAFLILDDCLYDATWTRDKLMRLLFMNGRHWKVMLVITMQYPLGVPPNLRTNIDYTFILREPYLTNRKRIYENYAGMFTTFESFCQVMDQCTENYECLVISNNAKSNKLEDQIFWYKATGHGEFKLGSKEFWELSKDLGSDDEDDQYDPQSFKKKGPRINVKKNKW